jgi:cyclohexyl-isocyanide hydratase
MTEVGALVTIGILIFPEVEELDFVGPFEVLSYINKISPGSTRVLLIAETAEPVKAFNGLRVIPDATFQTSPELDILVVPGGKGRMAAMKNTIVTDFIKKRQETARFITSVCTGAFLLAEAGLLAGRKATTYHSAFAELAAYGVRVTPDKVVRDGAIISAGGVSSGLELGFYLLRELFGGALAQEVAEKIEYAVDVASL